MLAANLSLKFCPRRESAAIRRKVQSVSGESFANILSAADKKIIDGKHFIFCQSSAANTRSFKKKVLFKKFWQILVLLATVINATVVQTSPQ